MQAYSRLSDILKEVELFDLAKRELSNALKLSIDDNSRSVYLSKYQQLNGLAQDKATPRHYSLLGVTSGASQADIKKAYRKIALRLHPDKASSECKVQFAVSENGIVALEKDTTMSQLQGNATWLFKLIGK